MPSRNSHLRTVELARRTGYSVQQLRNLEQTGVIPLAPRTASGYRIYTPIHVQAALAYRSLAAAIGRSKPFVIEKVREALPEDLRTLTKAGSQREM